MGVLWVVVGIMSGVAFGWFAAGWQHYLYRNPEHRENPASGRKLLVMRGGLALACATAGGLALRPDHYDPGPAVVTLAFSFVLLVLASTDFERRIIPSVVSYPSILVAGALCWAWPDRSALQVLAGLVVALAVVVAFFAFGMLVAAVLRFRSRPLGGGDAVLIVLLGLLLGWPAIMTGLLYGVVAAGVPGVILTVTGKGREFFSYGPYLVLGGLIPLLFPGNFV
jgi:leader peptidase (prepilin peptidase)/N-methyltransferase